MANSTNIYIKDENGKVCNILTIAMPKEDLELDLKNLLLGRGIQNGTGLDGKHFNGVKNLAFILCSMLVAEYSSRNYPALPLMLIGNEEEYCERKIIVEIGKSIYEDSREGWEKAFNDGNSQSLKALLVGRWDSLCKRVMK